MKGNVLVCEQSDGIAIWYLNRPSFMNSIDFAMLKELRKKVESVRFDSSIRVVIITGTGEKAFCAGADLKERFRLTPSEVKKYIFEIRDVFTSIERLNKPVIAAVNGIALGGGTELALACDIRLMSDNSMMGLTETKLAIIPGAGGTQRLPRIVGIGKAKELIFRGKKVGSKESLSIGLVNKVVSYDDLIKESKKIAFEICQTGPVAIEQAKYAINFGSEVNIDAGLAIESNAYWVCIPTKDRLEGLKSFMEKRAPVYFGE